MLLLCTDLAAKAFILAVVRAFLEGMICVSSPPGPKTYQEKKLFAYGAFFVATERSDNYTSMKTRENGEQSYVEKTTETACWGQ